MTRRMYRLLMPLVLVVVAGALALQATPAHADEVLLVSKLDGPQAESTCPQGSAGTGFGEMTYDTATNLLSWEITFSGLSGPAIAAHFHGPAAPGQDAGIQVTISDLTSPSTGSDTITETQEQQLLDGLWYINYHTDKCPGGEIRGQVLEASVGGIAEVPDVAATPLEASDSSGLSAGVLAAIASATAAAAVALSGGAAYAWRRTTK